MDYIEKRVVDQLVPLIDEGNVGRFLLMCADIGHLTPYFVDHVSGSFKGLFQLIDGDQLTRSTRKCLRGNSIVSSECSKLISALYGLQVAC